MRQIKFRAWDGKRMILPGSEPVMSYGRLDIGLAGDVRIYDREDYKPASVELMQFTGLLDKNGKDIYEGDILLDPMGMRQEVFFRDGSFATYIDKGMWLELSQNSSIDEMEVVGNIYENPDMIERAAA